MSVPQLKQARISGGLKGSVWTESVGTPVLLTAVMYYMRRGGWSITGVLLIQSKRICFGWHGVIAPCVGFHIGSEVMMFTPSVVVEVSVGRV